MGSPAVVGIVASAGGVTALQQLLQDLPADLPAVLLVALHLSPDAGSLLDEVLDRHCALPVARATDRGGLLAGTVRVAGPDRHLLVVDGQLRLGTGPAEHGHRPSHDAMLRSIAVDQGPRAVGVVLTGMLDDGAAGLACLARLGGRCLVQDSTDAEFASMPEQAHRSTPSAQALPLSGLAAALVSAVRAPVGAPAARAMEQDRELVRASLGR